jgi:hypothetical protein
LEKFILSRKLESVVINPVLFQGDGVFWYNLLKNGSGNQNTRHAGCPVLVGSKWGKCNLQLCLTNHTKFSTSTPEGSGVRLRL